MLRTSRLITAVACLACTTSDTTPRDASGGATRVDPVEADQETVEGREMPTRLRPGVEIRIPAGVVHVGVRPGSRRRNPMIVADLDPVEIPAFQIDRLPYPNDPAQPPRTVATRAEAAALCEAEEKRLCTELEWERSCKGPQQHPYPGGEGFDAESCSLDPLTCASPFDVLALGALTPEWTSSPATRGLGAAAQSAVTRGAPGPGPVEDHRCGARTSVDPNGTDPSVGFRCCKGPSSAAEYPTEPHRPVFRVQRTPDIEALRQALQSIPELASVASDFRLAAHADAERAAARGGRSLADLQWTVLEGLLEWSPIAGEALWIFAGRGGGSTVIAAIHPLPDGSFTHGASFVFQDETLPVAVQWDYGSPREILWTTCAECVGEEGSLAFREDNSAIVLQR